MKRIRVRFAPSPTGPLHIGGVRTALYNYLFAKKNKGDFILRIEDTDQTRYVEGAIEYILESLKWLGIEPNEGYKIGGQHGPYIQSERRDIYQKYAKELIDKGCAYYAFDTPEELDQWRKKEESKGNHSIKYGHGTRLNMRNSLSLSEEETTQLLNEKYPHTIRLKVDPGHDVAFNDIIRGEVVFRSDELDDKIMLKADGLPTYHLANIVDDHLMQISHVIRGEEWLSSTPHHVLLYRALDWEEDIPLFAHLPLILKPSGKGKLSKRDGAKFGFPVFPLIWRKDEEFAGFREEGFLPSATVNFLSLLGWHPEGDQEILSLDDMLRSFRLDKIVKSGAKFDFEKAKWFNQQHMLSMPDEEIFHILNPLLVTKAYEVDRSRALKIISLMKPRANTIEEIVSAGQFFFERVPIQSSKIIRKKWKESNILHFATIGDRINEIQEFKAVNLEKLVKQYIEDFELSFGNIMPLLRIAITGTTQGPDLFEIIELIGREEAIHRMNKAEKEFNEILEK